MNHLNTCDDKNSLVAYVYGECDALERERVEEHLRSCAACALERDQLQSVRETLGCWRSPDRTLGFRVVQDPPGDNRVRAGRRLPAWAQVAAAALVMAAGAAVANLDVRYGTDGLVVRTGWQQPSRSAARTEAASPTKRGADGPWRTELGALERELRRELSSLQLRGSGAAPAVPAHTGNRTAGQAEVLRQVRALIDESERNQRQELALRLAQVVRDFDAQREADLMRIDRGFGQIEGRTGAAVAQQRELLDYLVRVSQRR